MKNRTVIALLTVIAVLLGANLVVATAGTTWAQDRGARTTDRLQDERPTRGQERPTRGQERPTRGEQPERPTRPMPQREPRLVGITAVGNNVVLAWDNGAIETREVPAPR